MMHKNYNILTWLFLFILPLGGLCSQDTLPSDRVEVIKRFEAMLEQTEKITLAPSIPEPPSDVRDFSYDFSANTVPLKIRRTNLQSNDLIPPEPPTQYDHLLSIGYRHATGWEAEGFIHQDLSKQRALSLSGQILQHNQSDWRDRLLWRAEAAFKSPINDHLETYVSASARANQRHLYPLFVDSLDQSNFERSNLDLTALFGVHYQKESTDVLVELDGANYRDKLDLNQTDLGSHLEWELKNSNGSWGATADLRISNIGLKSTDTTLFMASIRPQYQWSFERGHLIVGATLNHADRWAVGPQVNFRMGILDRLVILELKAGLDTDNHDLRGHDQFTDFISTTPQSFNTDNVYSAGLGLDGVAGLIKYGIETSYEQQQNNGFWVNYGSMNSTFSRVFAETKSVAAEGFAELSLNADDKMGVRGKIVQYLEPSEFVPSHEALQSIQLYASALFWDRLRLQSDVIWVGSREAAKTNGLISDLDSFLDVNVSLQFELHSQWLLYTRIFNLLNNDYQWMSGFENTGFMGSIGLIYRHEKR